jgi:hypothetical protein
MKRKWLIGILSMLLVLGLGVTVSADWNADDGGAGAIAPSGTGTCDIEYTKALLFPPVEGVGIAKYLKLGVKVKDGTELPGILQFNIDADNSASTGLQSSMFVFGQRTHNNYGFDIGISIALRDQSPSSTLANPQYGGLGHALKGEWIAIATYYVGTTVNMINVDHGRVGGYCTQYDDLPCGPYETEDPCTDATGECFRLPWLRIVDKYYNHPARGVGNPNFTLGFLHTWCNKPRYEAIAFLDPTFADGDDYVTTGSYDVEDLVPKAATTDDFQCGNDYCFEDYPQDGGVDGADLAIFRGDFGRSTANNPCPSCAPYPAPL